MKTKKEIGWLLREKYPYYQKINARVNMPPEIRDDIKRLSAGEPPDYVIGFTEFLGCKIDLSKKVFIPRPETQFWTEKAIADILTFSRMSECKNKKMRVLDLFAGSGCIGLAILAHIKNSYVVFSDKEKNCLEQIKINLKLNSSHIRAKKRWSVVRSDVFSDIKGKFDYIFTNPPYCPTATIDQVEESVLKFEPHKALLGGKNGLLYTIKFLKQAKGHLKAGGKIFIELNSRQKGEVEKIIKKYGYKNCEFHKDQYGKWRWVMIE